MDNSRFIVTARVTNPFSGESGMIYLGPWAIPEDAALSPADIRKHMMPNPWEDRERHLSASTRTNGVYEKYLALVSGYLNTTLGCSHDIKYWRILIGFWLWHYIGIFYDRYVLIKEAFNLYPDGETVLLDPECYLPTVDMEDYLGKSISSDDVYNFQLFSQIMTGLKMAFPVKKVLLNRTAPGGSLKSRLIGAVKNTASRWMSCRMETADIVLNGQIDIDCQWRIKKEIKGNLFFLDNDFPGSIKADALSGYSRDMRHGLGGLPHENEFEALLVNSFEKNFPVMYLEGYHQSRDHVRAFYMEKTPAIFCSVCGIMSNELAKFYAAELSTTRTTLVNVQHGGNYGITSPNPYEDHEIKTSHLFGCWGWGDGERLVNLPSFKLVKYACPGKTDRKRIASNRTILLVGTAHPRYLYRFWGFPAGTQWYDYLADCIQFCEGLGSRLLSEVLYRPYPHEFGWRFPELMKKEIPGLAIENSRHSFKQRLGCSRIVVCDHNATTYLESLVKNHPTIVFFDPALFEIKPEAKPCFDLLKEAGIYFDDPDSAAQMVRDSYDNIHDWWMSGTVQSARDKFIRQFAYTTGDWTVEWNDFFREQMIN